ncbi:hypothetical protein DXG01_006217 [Tephrocybe rancida]|nr:hypothetical protein DXG01_006217 [Tephrocybe rancida]
MTEYDLSPEAYDRYIASQQRIANWVNTTEGHRNEYGNALTVPASVASSHTQADRHPLSPLKIPFRRSQSRHSGHRDHSHPHSQPPCLPQSHHAPSRQPSAANLHTLQSQHSSLHAPALVSPAFLAPQPQHPPTGPRHTSSTNLSATHAPPTSSYVHAAQPQSFYGSSHYEWTLNLPTPSYHSRSHPLQSPQPTHFSAHPRTLSRHHSSITLQQPEEHAPLQEASPAYLLKVPPSNEPTYVYAASRFVSSAGLVILPSGNQNTSIVISPPMAHSPQSGGCRATTPAAYSATPSPYHTPVGSPRAPTPTSTHSALTQTVYPASAYTQVPACQHAQPVPPVLIIEYADRRRKGSERRKSKKKDKRSGSTGRD